MRARARQDVLLLAPPRVLAVHCATVSASARVDIGRESGRTSIGGGPRNATVLSHHGEQEREVGSMSGPVQPLRHRSLVVQLLAELELASPDAATAGPPQDDPVTSNVARCPEPRVDRDGQRSARPAPPSRGRQGPSERHHQVHVALRTQAAVQERSREIQAHEVRSSRREQVDDLGDHLCPRRQVNAVVFMRRNLGPARPPPARLSLNRAM